MEREFNIEFLFVTVTVLPAENSNYIVTVKKLFSGVEIPALIGILYPSTPAQAEEGIKWTSDDNIQPELIDILGDIIEDMKT